MKKVIARAIMTPLSADEEGARHVPTYADHDSFFPTPKMTFLYHQPKNLVCQICTVMPLKMASSSSDVEETIPAILPCGHVACSGCMSDWFNSLANPANPDNRAKDPSCPFCRTALVYSGCGHHVKPRKIAEDTVSTIPRTLAENGAIPTKCVDCYKKAFAKHAKGKAKKLKTAFYKACQEAEENPCEESQKKREVDRKAFARIGANLESDFIREMQARW